MIVIIDYNIGNLGSVVKALAHLKIPAKLTSNHDEVREADAIILPGVGAFGEGMNNLKQLKLADLIKSEVKSGKPFLGICLGMQLLFTSSEEDKDVPGLNLIPGGVKRFDPGRVGKVPHIGWNQVKLLREDPLFKNLDRKNFYFVHSYYTQPVDEAVALGKTSYGNHEFVSVVQQGNIWGIQCHPEKSSKIGLKVLRNFSEVIMTNGGHSSN